MTINAQEALIGNLRDIGLQVELMSERYFSQDDVVGIDYLSVFTTESMQYEELCIAAASLGTRVAEKRGGVFRLNEDIARELPTAIVRISEPGDTSLRGCGDIIPASFGTAKSVLLEAGFSEVSKSLNGERYTIIEVTDYAMGVSLYVPSMRMTELMGITK